MDYNHFEGVIPEGEYGGGTVMIWDYGTWVPEIPQGGAMPKGEVKFSLYGRKLAGSWVLVHTDARRWLLIKHRDRYAREDFDVTVEKPRSAVSRRGLAGIARAAGATPKQLQEAAATDPPRP